MPTGRRDPDRVARIADAVIEVVSRLGVEGLTHRAVAKAADVPLGSTTYYFASRDDLLQVALRHAIDAWKADLQVWVDGVARSADLATAIADWHVAATRARHDRSVVEYELYVASFRRPALQQLAAEWDRALQDAFQQVTGDADTGRLLTLVASGLILQSLARGVPLSRAEVLPLLRQTLASR